MSHTPMQIPLSLVNEAFDVTYTNAWQSLASKPRDPECAHCQILSHVAWCDNSGLPPHVPIYMTHSYPQTTQRILACVRCRCCTITHAHYGWHNHNLYMSGRALPCHECCCQQIHCIYFMLAHILCCMASETTFFCQLMCPWPRCLGDVQLAPCVVTLQ